MGSRRSFSSFMILAFWFLQILHLSINRADASSKLYIVYIGEKKHNDPNLVTASHHDMLTSLFGSKQEAVDSLVYSYKHGFSGFAAMLNESQAQILTDLPEVISVTPNHHFQAQTTRSWDFLGINYNSQSNGLLQKAKYGENIIIGMIDSGIWPESKSFEDTGYGPIPSKWKGTCQTGEAFNANNCTKKIIGARWYKAGASKTSLEGEYMSARDYANHGTHTASTAGGNLVANRSFYSLATGSVRGGAPRARLAIYKACWGLNAHCSGADVIAAIDDAINDGVDILSLSIGGANYEFPGTLHAVAKGISVIFAAGNNGPAPQTIQNNAPWVITVAASTIDRSFPTAFTLGNNLRLVGQSVYYETTKSNNSFATLVDGSTCDSDTLASINVNGSIVLCYDQSSVITTLPRATVSTTISNVLNAGGRGLIFAQYTVNVLENLEQCQNQGVPCVLVDFEIANKISSYIYSTSVPYVKVSPTYNVIGDEVLAPKVAAFSSRGPSNYPGILKPDISAPGVSILAAMRGEYRFSSGTSMACPHVTGVVALLKALHPDWSPAVIKSAIVTTASVVDKFGAPIKAESTPRKLADPFDYGGGHIDPNRAADPGLVYDINPNEYTKLFDCTLGPADDCDSSFGDLYQLNLPSIVIPDLKDRSVTVLRTVTNVGPTNSSYKASVQAPPGVEVTVVPDLISFDGDKKDVTFKVTFVAARKVQGDYTFGSLSWSDGSSHTVKIPIAVRTIIQDYYADTA